MELELFQEMYGTDEFWVIEPKGSSGVVTFAFSLKPRTGVDTNIRVRAELHIELGPDYPEVPPKVHLLHCRGLAEADAERILSAAREVADANAGVECAYAVLDAAVEALSAANDAPLDCNICLSQIVPEEADDSVTSSCFHSFHQQCVYRWVSQIRSEALAVATGADNPMQRHVAACRGDALSKRRALDALVGQLEEAKLRVSQCQDEVGEAKACGYDAEGEVGEEYSKAEAAARIREAERHLTAAIQQRESLKGRVRAAKGKWEEAESRLCVEEEKLVEKVADSVPPTPCPVCRTPLDWSSAQDAAWSLWNAAGPPVSTCVDTAGPDASKAALDALNADTKAYLALHKERMAAVIEAQRAAGGIIDLSSLAPVVVGALPQPPLEPGLSDATLQDAVNALPL